MTKANTTKKTTTKPKRLSVFRLVSQLNLSQWCSAMAALFLVYAVVLVQSANHAQRSITTSFLTPDNITHQITGQPSFATASKQLWNLNMAHLGAAFFAAIGIIYVLAAIIWRRNSSVTISGKSQPLSINHLSWLDFGFSIVAIATILALINGVSDLSALVMLAALGLCSVIFGQQSSVAANYRYDSADNYISWANCLRILAVSSMALLWLVVGASLLGTYVFGLAKLPLAVYIFIASIAVSSIGSYFYLMHCYKSGKDASVSKSSSRNDVSLVNGWYRHQSVFWILSIASKVLLFWLLLVGKF